ncbi:UPF0260 protein ycgN [Rhizobium sp. PDO1-076]|nr:UPF0260 protein ycgN [Rhizobium sp. PDO1-076]
MVDLAAKNKKNCIPDIHACMSAGIRTGMTTGTRASMADGMTETPYWKTKRLVEMSLTEWEALCDGCGLCCLNKLEDWDTGEVVFTSVACTLLDGNTCQCKDYPHRQTIVPDCIQLTPDQVDTIAWLPPTCGYRLVHEGRDLYWWHPLVSGDPDTVHQAGISARGRTISEDDVDVEDFEDFVVYWPLTVGEGVE